MNDESEHEGYIRNGTPLMRDFFALLGIKSARRKRREREQEEQ
jgi:hypothetical protein